MPMRNATLATKSLATWGLLLLTWALSGCGSPTAEVSGIVTYKGRPLPSGTVLFHSAEGRIEHGLVTAEGRYTIVEAPLGSVRITVQSHAQAPKELPTRGGKPPATPAGPSTPAIEKRDGKYVQIPRHYLDPAKSGLTYVVQAGSQTHDIDLPP